MPVVKLMRAAVAVLVIIAAGGESVFAQENPRNAVVNAQRVGPTPLGSKVISKSHQPVGTPHKASSFAPHHSNRRVYGDPIQPPIVHNIDAAKSKTPAPK